VNNQTVVQKAFSFSLPFSFSSSKFRFSSLIKTSQISCGDQNPMAKFVITTCRCNGIFLRNYLLTARIKLGKPVSTSGLLMQKIVAIASFVSVKVREPLYCLSLVMFISRALNQLVLKIGDIESTFEATVLIEISYCVSLTEIIDFSTSKGTR